MRRIRTASVVCALLMVVALIAPASVLAQEADAFPSGRYDGSARADSKPESPVSLKVWLVERADGMVGITISSPRLPVPISAADAMPRKVTGGYDLDLSVNYGSGKMGVNGSGLLRIRQRADGWHLWATGSGTALGKSGSGRASATRMTESVSMADQVGGSLLDFFGGGEKKEEVVSQPSEYPEEEFAEPPAEAAAPADDVGDTDAPSDLRDMLIIIVTLMIMLVFGITFEGL